MIALGHVKSLAFIALIVMPIQAIATKQQHYIKLDFGIRIPANKFIEKPNSIYLKQRLTTESLYGIGLGYILNDFVRADLNLHCSHSNYRAASVKDNHDLKQRMKFYNIMLNGYFDINVNKSFVPYFVTGVGYAINKTGTLQDSSREHIYPGKNTRNLAWNIGPGVKFVINDHFNLDLSYRYVFLCRIKTRAANEDLPGGSQKILLHEILGGIVLIF